MVNQVCHCCHPGIHTLRNHRCRPVIPLSAAKEGSRTSLSSVKRPWKFVGISKRVSRNISCCQPGQTNLRKSIQRRSNLFWWNILHRVATRKEETDAAVKLFLKDTCLLWHLWTVVHGVTAQNQFWRLDFVNSNYCNFSSARFFAL